MYNQPCLLLGFLPVSVSALIFTGEWEERERDCLGLGIKLVGEDLESEGVGFLVENVDLNCCGLSLVEVANLL